MSRIPNCREDGVYNEKYLTEKDKAEVTGYDWCAEEVVGGFFDNLEDFFEKDSYLGHTLYEKLPEDMQGEYTVVSSFGHNGETKEVAYKCENYADLLHLKLCEWFEVERNEMIMSMIDNNMSDDEYEED